MTRQKMITVAAEDIHERVVGTLAAFQHKLYMANEPEYREMVREVERRPRTFQEMFGLPERTPMRMALGL